MEQARRVRDAAGLRENTVDWERLAHGAAAEEMDHGQQQHCADESCEQRAAVEAVATHQGAVRAEEAAEQEAAEQRTDDADDDVEKDTLLGIGAHDDARQPADDAPDDKRQNETHDKYSRPVSVSDRCGSQTRRLTATIGSAAGPKRKGAGRGPLTSPASELNRHCDPGEADGSDPEWAP